MKGRLGLGHLFFFQAIAPLNMLAIMLASKKMGLADLANPLISLVGRRRLELRT